MANLKIVSRAYINQDALDREITGYIYPKAFLIGGLAVNPNAAVEQMKLIKRIWNQTGGKQLHHFILNFSPWESSRITSEKKFANCNNKLDTPW